MRPNELAALVALYEAECTPSDLALKIAATLRDTDKAVEQLAHQGLVERAGAVVRITNAGCARIGRPVTT